MKTAEEYVQLAEEWMEKADYTLHPNAKIDVNANRIARAQVYATLAAVAATQESEEALVIEVLNNG